MSFEQHICVVFLRAEIIGVAMQLRKEGDLPLLLRVKRQQTGGANMFSISHGGAVSSVSLELRLHIQ